MEDENHLLFECQMHEIERKELHLYVNSNINIGLSPNETPENKIQEIFSSENLGTLNALGKFIKKCITKTRKYNLSYSTSTLCVLSDNNLSIMRCK